MNTIHLKYCLNLNELLGAPVGDYVSEYTSKAISYSVNGFSPTVADYDKAYDFMVKKYDVLKLGTAGGRLF